MDRYNEQKKKKQSMLKDIASIGGSMAGGFTGSIGKTMFAALFSQLAVPSILKLTMPEAVVTWDKKQEDEADQLALQYMFTRNYDPREVPKFYTTMQAASMRDSRSGSGFMADKNRVADRVKEVGTSINGFSNLSATSLYVGATTFQAKKTASGSLAPLQPAGPDIGKGLDPNRDNAARAETAGIAITTGPLSEELKKKIDNGELIGTSAEFEAVMAELKRDNGVRAYYYDMFQMSRENLEESISIRGNDPFAHYYYGKVLKLTARTASEKEQALSEFVKAADLDKRRVLGEPRLFRALAMIDAKDTAQAEIVKNLKEYVSIYQRGHGGQLPPNMDVIYDYLQEVGETSWAAHPATNVSTKDIDPIGIDSPATVAPATASTAASAPAQVAPPAARPNSTLAPRQQPRKP